MIVTNGTEKQIIFQLGETLAAIEEQIVAVVLENNHYNIKNTAKALGLKRTTLSQRISVRYPWLREPEQNDCPVTPAGACPCNDKTDN